MLIGGWLVLGIRCCDRFGASGIAYILLYHSLWFTLFVAFAGFPIWGAAMVLGFNWLTFLIAAARVSAATKASATLSQRK